MEFTVLGSVGGGDDDGGGGGGGEGGEATGGVGSLPDGEEMARFWHSGGDENYPGKSGTTDSNVAT